MVKRELNKFEFEYSSQRYECEAPSSLVSIVGTSDSGGDLATFSTVISVDEVALSIKYTFLRFKGIESPCDVIINDKKIAAFDGEHTVYTLDVGAFLKVGDNRLSLKFPIGDDTEPQRVGIFSPIELVRFNNAVIDRVAISQKHADGVVTLGVNLSLLGSTENARAVAMLVSPSGQIYYAGLTKGEGSITVANPLYWWPHGYGIQNLYKLTVNLYSDNEIEDTVEMRVGLRTMNASDEAGDSAIIVNGSRILPMGAVYSVDRDPMAKNADKKMNAYVTSAAMANYNTFILRCEDRNPPEKFFELCDMHGIMVVREVKDFTEGRLDSLSRCSTHASFGLIDIIGDDTNADLMAENISNATAELDFSLFKSSPAYLSEISIPTDSTLDDEIPENERNLFSYSVETLAGRDAIEKMLLSVSERYPYPSTLSDFAYASRLAAALNIEEGIKKKRLSRGTLGRAVFSSLGDSSVAISSSAIDSFARWKALQYASQRFFEPASVYAEARGGVVTFSVSNERRLDFMGSIEYRVINSKNEVVHKGSRDFEFDALSSRVAFECDLTRYIVGFERDHYLEYLLKEGTSTLSKKTLLFVPEKYFCFEYPAITTEITGNDRRFCVTLSAKRFARGVELSLGGVDAVFSDNYFDITSNYPFKVTFNLTGRSVSLDELKKLLEVRCVYDLNHKLGI